jgi:hypothetical protein
VRPTLENSLTEGSLAVSAADDCIPAMGRLTAASATFVAILAMPVGIIWLVDQFGGVENDFAFAVVGAGGWIVGLGVLAVLLWRASDPFSSPRE